MLSSELVGLVLSQALVKQASEIWTLNERHFRVVILCGCGFNADELLFTRFSVSLCSGSITIWGGITHKKCTSTKL